MSAPPLLRAPGINNRNKNPKSPRLKLATLKTNTSTPTMMNSLTPPPRLTIDRPTSVYQEGQSSSSSASLLSATTTRLTHLEINDSYSHTPTPSTATSDVSLGMFSAEIMAEIDAPICLTESGKGGKNVGKKSPVGEPVDALSKRRTDDYNDDNADAANDVYDDNDKGVKTEEATKIQKGSEDEVVIEADNTSGEQHHDEVEDEEATLLRPRSYRHKDVNELDEQEWKVVNKRGEIIELGILGEGAGGSVSRCKLKYGHTIFALKMIISDANAETQKQILRELQFNKSCKSPYIVKYYGMFLNEENASICISMEYMGGRSLDAIYKKVKERGGRIGEKVLGKIAESVLKGLSYLHEHRIIHRDIKPQNILLDSKGNVKLCDFGVSGVVVNSLATTFTGTSYYMAPERIQGHPYSVTCDVWSLGLTLLEVARGQFPLDIDVLGTSPFEVLTLITTFTPRLEDDSHDGIVWTGAFRSFIDYCLKKNPSERASPRQMLSHPWVVGQSKKTVNMEKFIKQCWDDTLDS